MAKYDVFSNAAGEGYLLDVQAELLYSDNVTRSEYERDARDDSALALTATAGVHLQPGMVQLLVGPQGLLARRGRGGEARRIGHDEVEALIVKCSGTHFDPAVVEAFVKISPILRNLSESDDLHGMHEMRT